MGLFSLMRRATTSFLSRSSSTVGRTNGFRSVNAWNGAKRTFQSNSRERFYQNSQSSWTSSSYLTGAAMIAAGCVSAYQLLWGTDYEAVRKDIEDILEDLDYDDGSYGPVFVRLAWHASGTYSKIDGSGGSNGATMRFEPECSHGANAGLDVARKRLEAVKAKHDISYADLWVLASIVAIEEMGGPKIKFTPGRSDKPSGKFCTPDGRLPDAAQGAQHIRDIFYRMGMNDGEIVALIGGGHAIGRCHTNRSGFDGPWTNSPTTFTNSFFTQLLNNKWTPKKWNGPHQYEDPSGSLMMLPSDMALLQDPSFRAYVRKYAEDEELFFKDFASAYEKLTNLGRKL